MDSYDQAGDSSVPRAFSGVHDLVADRVRAAPHHPAVREVSGRSLSYEELWRESGRVTTALQERGVGPGDPVLVAVNRSVELVVAVLGVLRAGAWYVLPDPHAPQARQEMVVEEVRPRVVVVSSRQSPWTVAADVPRLSLPLAADDAPATCGKDVAVGPEDTAYVAYTSGSTGRPKGAVAPHRAVVNFLHTPTLVPLTAADRVASLSSPASDATTLEVLGTLAAGATVVVLPQAFEVGVEEWVRTVRDERVTVMFLMTPLFDLIAQEAPDAFRSLDTLIFGGDAPNIDTVRRVCATAPPRRLVLGYGPTEATVFATRFVCTTDSLAGRTTIPLGEPLENYTIHVLDRQLREVPPGQEGELCVAGPGVANGYLRRPDLTERQFVRRVSDDGTEERLYRSGDLVRREPDGTLEFVGRVDRQVKIRGFRVEPGEVERAVLATGLAEAAVVAKAGEGHRGHLVCFYVPTRAEDDAEGGEEAVRRRERALRRALVEQLPGYMIPAVWRAVPRMPLTSNGKIDRSRLLAELTK